MQVIMGNYGLVAARECLQSPPAFLIYPQKFPFSASQRPQLEKDRHLFFPSASLEEDIISAITAIFSLQGQVQCAFPSRL